MKSITLVITILFFQINISAQTSFKKVLYTDTTSTFAFNLIVNENNDIIIPGFKIYYNNNETVYKSYLCKVSEIGEILLEKETVLQDTAIVHRDIVEGEVGKFWTYTFSFDKYNRDTQYFFKLSEYDYDFNLYNEFNFYLPDSLHYHWWKTRLHTRLRYHNNQLILSDLLTNEKVNNDGYYNKYTFFYHFNINGDSISFNMKKNFGARFEVKLYDNETLYSVKYESAYPSGVIINKINIEDFNIFETFHTDSLPFTGYNSIAPENAYIHFISDTTFLFSAIDSQVQANISILDTSFNIIKNKAYGTDSFQEFPARNNGLAVANDGNIYTVHSRGIATEYMLTKLDTDLNVIWERFFISGGDFLYSIKATADGGCVILGNTSINSKYHILLYKVDVEGNVVGINDNKTEKVFKELSLYPNPGTSQLNIRTAVQRLGGVFKMYDVSGKQVFQQNIKQSITQINTEHLPAGAYVYNYVHEGKVIENGKWVKE